MSPFWFGILCLVPLFLVFLVGHKLHNIVVLGACGVFKDVNSG